MWMLAKDHLRRTWKWIAIWSLLFGFTLFNDGYFAENSANRNGSFFLSIYSFYIMLALNVRAPSDTNIIRVWRTLPFRESTLARLLWSMTALTAPALSFLIVLLVELLLLHYGKTYAQPIVWPFLFLLLATLCSGPLTLLHTSLPLGYASATAARNAQRRGLFSTSYAVKEVFAFVLAGATLYMMLYPTPYRWSDLGSRHFVGMCVAAYLIWKSYRMRSWLLQPISPQSAVAHETPNSKIAFPYYGSALAALTQELKTIVRRMLLVVLGCIGLGHLLLFCMTWSGLAPRGSDLYEVSAQTVTFLAVGIPAMLVLGQLTRICELGSVRCLPLTGKQCVLLFLSYPYAASLAAIPCIAAYLWLLGYGTLPTLLLTGILISASLCPFAMFMLARFGGRGLLSIIVIGIICAGPGPVVTTLFNVHLPLMSTPILCAGVLVLAVLGVVGYYGLRYLIENNSAVYKRKMFPQQFGQR